MDSQLKHFLLGLGWKAPYLRFLSTHNTVTLLYHGIPKKGDGKQIDSSEFERQIVFLKQYFEIIPPDRLWERRKLHDKIRVILTFDDGFRNHAEIVAPMLRKYNVPAMFFVCSRHSIPGKYLWFSYLQALEQHFPDKGFYFRGDFFDMSSGHRQYSIDRLRVFLLNLEPHPSAMYEAIEEELPKLEDLVNAEKLADRYAGMTAEQVGQLARDPLFSVGVHTVDHPFLTKCKPAEAFRQIRENKRWIERVSNRKCNTIAYPSGDYNSVILQQCRALAFSCGHAVIPTLNINRQLELPRIGLYSTSLDTLGFKVQWGNFMRGLGMKIG